MTYEEIVHFHGHKCPGLAIGYRMSVAAMDALASLRAEDEELVAVVENDACGVDALQCLSGCTFGKGNLIFRDYGKQVYTVYARRSRRGVRILFHGKNIPDDLRGDRPRLEKWILSAEPENILTVESITDPEPEPARIRKSIPCEACGEAVMESRIRELKGRHLCIPCSEQKDISAQEVWKKPGL